MVVFRDFIRGRMGNQMFFVASTIGIARKNNLEYGFSSNMAGDYQSIFKKELPITSYIPERKYNQESFNYYDVLLEDDVEIMGYFQSEKFFKEVEDEIRNQFEIKESVIDYVISCYPEVRRDSLSIHIRRGDYLDQPNHHPSMPISYYEKILKDIKKNYQKIFIFSDDLEWAKINFVGEEYIFPEFDAQNDLNCFVLMSMCKDNVISNSTYSWWAAWLNKNKDKKVYAPISSKWFGPAYANLDTKDIIPNSWIQVDYES